MLDFDNMDEKEESLYKVIGFLLFLVLFLYYFYILLYSGTRSYAQLKKLEENYYQLSKRVDKLKKENVLLQKKYFELRELEGSDF